MTSAPSEVKKITKLTEDKSSGSCQAMCFPGVVIEHFNQTLKEGRVCHVGSPVEKSHDRKGQQQVKVIVSALLEVIVLHFQFRHNP